MRRYLILADQLILQLRISLVLDPYKISGIVQAVELTGGHIYGTLTSVGLSTRS